MANSPLDGTDPIQIRSTDGSVIVEGSGSVDLRVLGASGAAGARFFIPAGVTTNAAVVAAVLAGNTALRFGVGSYGLEAPLFTGLTPAQLSGVDIQGEGRETVLEPTYISPAGLASTPTNAVVLVQGAPQPAIYNSVLTRRVVIGDRSMTVAASLAARTGNWVVLSGHLDPATQMAPFATGEAITNTELQLVESTSGAGLIVTTGGAFIQEHTITNGGTGVPQSVQAVDPVVSFRLARMRIVGTGHQIAVGVLMDYVVQPVLEDLWFEGFSMADYFARLGTTAIDFRSVTHEGGSNGWCYLQSVTGGAVTGTRSTGRGPRFHPLGLIQGVVNIAWNTAQIKVTDSVLRKACRGIQIAAVQQIDILNFLVDDMFIAELLVRPAIAESSFCGVGLDTGRGPLNETQFGMGIRIEGRFTNCRSDGPIDPLSPYVICLHDILDCELDVSIVNEGESPYAVIDGQNYVMQGIFVQDSGGRLSATIRGCEFAFSPRSVAGRLHVDEMIIHANSGAGTVTAFSVYQQSVINNGLTYGRLDAQSPVTYSNASPEDVVRMESLSADGFEFRSTTTMVNTTGVTLQIGDLCQPNPAGIDNMFQPCPVIAAAAGVPLAVCCTSGGQAVNGRAFDGCALPTTDFVVNVTAAAVVPNDILDFGAGAAAKANNAAAIHTAIGRSLSFKAAGAPGMVRAGAVT